MVFSDPVFLFAFLPVSLILILLAVPRAHNLAILVFSLVFYYWTSGWLTLLLAASIVGNWLIGRAIHARSQGRLKQRLMMAGVVANLLALAYFKYAYFIAGNIDFALGLNSSDVFAAVILPIGISFFTFQGISYLIDLRRGEIEAEPNLIRFGAYLSFFPQLIAGPIVRYHDVYDDFRRPKLTLENFAGGATRFLHGLLKKVLIADAAGRVADTCFGMSDDIGMATAWIGALAYTIQIYFDFSGYSDMAIGIGRMCGIRFLENFRHPYSSSTITEFWRRWHISLSSWFRDYLYIPLGGNRNGSASTYRNLAIVFLVTGLWHGAAWTYVVWGLYHGAFLVLERLVMGRRASEQKAVWLRFVYLLPVVMVGWVIFRAESMAGAADYLLAMVSISREGAFDIAPSVTGTLPPLNLIALGLGMLIFFLPREPVGGQLAMKVGGARTEAGQLAYTVVAGVLAAMLVLVSNFSPFLYFQF